MKWVWRGIAGGTLVMGWIFILSQNRFHVDPPVVVVMLAYLAVVAMVINLWRVGAAAVAEDRADDTWARPLGERGDLEKEKRTLLRSIKETEFDQAMGKLSKPDAEQLIQMYRTRAIEVIKELDRIDVADAGAQTPRQQIEREVAARLEIEAKKRKARNKAKGKGDKAEKADEADAGGETVRSVEDAEPNRSMTRGTS